MLKKVCHLVFGLCMVAGFILMIGTTGSSDLNLIDWNTIVKQSVISVVLMLVGYFGLKFTDWEYID